MASREDLISPDAAQRENAATPKIRSRKDGAAVPLDDVDRKVLNLMQGKFPIATRPYRHVAELGGGGEFSETEVMARVQRLLEKRIIRQVTPIFDTRALGYSSMLVAAKVDPEHPHRAAHIINEHPGVSHNYLRNHDFNLWFTIATEPDSKLGLQGTLDVLARESGAESVRQLPTLKLFKIRMDLEMEGDTKSLSSQAAVTEPVELDPQPYDEKDIAVIRALQGDMPVVEEPYAAAAAELGIEIEEGRDSIALSGRRGIEVRADDLLDRAIARLSANARDAATATVVAAGAVRYYLLKFSLNQIIAFDFDDALRVTGDTGVYLQYAHARAAGILRKVADDALPVDVPSALHPAERELLHSVEAYARALTETAHALSPSLLTTYAFGLAAAFSDFYEHTPAIVREEDPVIRRFRRGLVAATRATLADALHTLGMAAPDQV